MTLPRTVADVLTDHVVFEVECIDRMYLNVYVPGLQYAAGLVAFVHRQLDLPIASTAPLGKISDGFTAGMHRFARDQHVPWVDFVKGQRKDDVMHEHLARFDAEEGVLFIGRAQEKTGLFRNARPPRPGSGSPRWTTGSPPATTRPRCKRSATDSGRRRSTPCSTSGWRSCPARSPTPIGPRATATSSRRSKPSSP